MRTKYRLEAYAIYSRDWAKAIELFGSMSNEELRFGGGPFVPRECLEIPIAKYQRESSRDEG